MSNLSELLPAGGAAKEFEVVASGTLPNGKPVVMKSDGTVEVVAESVVSGGDGITAGTPVVFESATSEYTSVAMLTSTKAIVTYKDNGNSSYGTSCILNVSGSTITAGTPVVFESAYSAYTSVAMLTSTKAIVVYSDVGNSNYGTSRILDVSGTSITVGNSVVYESANSGYDSVAMLTSTKAIVVYVDNGNTGYGTSCILNVSGSTITTGTPKVFESAYTAYTSVAMLTTAKAIVVYSDSGSSDHGTSCILDVSGSTITAGTPVVYESSDSYYSSVASLTSTKAIVVYQKNGSGNYGTSRILDVSGTSITVGSPAVFEAASTYNTSVATLTSTKAIVTYKDGGNSGYGTSCILDVSSSTITAGTPTVFNTSNSNYDDFMLVAAMTSVQAIVVYSDYANSGYGTSCILDNSSTTTNLTTANFAGTSTAAFTNGQTATIVPQGGVSTNQTSLTIGSTYYVQPAGTLATSAGSPSVVAGKALSATSLLLKGNS